MAAGDYVISEDAFKGYTASYNGADSSGKVTLAPGESKTVTITNNDNPLPSSVIDSSEGEKPVAVTTTITGGQLPKTSTHLYELLLMGAALTMLGALGFTIKKRYE